MEDNAISDFEFGYSRPQFRDLACSVGPKDIGECGYAEIVVEDLVINWVDSSGVNLDLDLVFLGFWDWNGYDVLDSVWGRGWGKVKSVGSIEEWELDVHS